MILRLFLFIFSVFLISCGQKTAENTDVRIEAYKHIDSGNAEEAIQILESHIEKDNDPKLKVILASAYANLAGFTIKGLVPVIETIERFKELTEDKNKEDNSNKEEKKNKSIGDGNALAQLGIQIAKVSLIYEALPKVPEEKVAYLHQALSILDSIEAEMSPEDRIYRSVLSLYSFKYLLNRTRLGYIAEFEECSIQPGEFRDHLLLMGETLLQVFTDYAIAKPSKAKKMGPVVEDLTKFVESLTQAAGAIIVLDETIITSLSMFGSTDIYKGLSQCAQKDSDLFQSLFVPSF